MTSSNRLPVRRALGILLAFVLLFACAPGSASKVYAEAPFDPYEVIGFSMDSYSVQVLTKQGYEYVVAKDGEAPDWTDARYYEIDPEIDPTSTDAFDFNSFDGLLPLTDYVVYARTPAQGSEPAGDPLTFAFTTFKPNSTTSSTVLEFWSVPPTLEAVLVRSGEAADWSLAVSVPGDEAADLTFDDLDPGTLYTLYMRTKATDTEPAGEAVAIPYITLLNDRHFDGPAMVGSRYTFVTDPADLTDVTYRWFYDTSEENEEGVIVFSEEPIARTPDPVAQNYIDLTEADLGKRVGVELFIGGVSYEVFDNSYFPVRYGTVTFNLHDDPDEPTEIVVGSEGPDGVGFVYGDTMNNPTFPELKDEYPADPTRDGDLFAGWFIELNSPYEHKWDFDNEIIDTEWLPLEAKWVYPSWLDVEVREGYEYVVAPIGEDPDWTDARQPDPALFEYSDTAFITFEGLMPATDYTVFSRPVGSDDPNSVTATDRSTEITAYGAAGGDNLVGTPITMILDADPDGLTYQWYRDGEAIANATEREYTLAPEDADKAISYRVFFHDTPMCEFELFDGAPVTYGTVIFDSRGGSEVPSATGLVYEDMVPEPEAPEKADAEFLGWFLDLGTPDEYEWDFSWDCIFSPETTLSAKWSENYVAPTAPAEPAGTAEESDAASVSADELQKAADENAPLTVETENGTVKLDADLVRDLAEGGAPVEVTVTANEDGTTTFDVTAGGEPVDASIRVAFPAAAEGRVLVIVNADGTEEIVKKSVVEGDTVYAEIPAGATVKVVENDVPFTDVEEDDWYAETVAFTASHELFEGTGNGEFEPDLTMSRAMMVTVLFRLEGAEAPDTVTFTEVPADEWYFDAAQWAGEEGIVEGTDAGFDAEAPATREEIAVMLYRYAKMLGLDTTATGDLGAFTDGGDASDWADEALRWAVGNGLFEGYDDGTLNPKGEATRAEAATLITRLVKLLVKE